MIPADAVVPEGVLAVTTSAPAVVVDHGARAHHKFSMSKLNHIDPSVGGCRGYSGRDGTSLAAEEGTALHEIVEKVLRAYLREGAASGKKLSEFAAAFPRTWEDEAHTLLTFCFTYLDRVLTPGVKVFIELRARVRRDSGEEVNYGHLDLYLCYPNKTARLIDWKFGYNPVVPAATNRQALGYAAAMFQQFGDEAIEVVFVQPKLGWVSRHVYQKAQTAEMVFRIERLIAEATRVQSVDPMDPAELNPGSACEYCRHSGICPAYLREYGKGVAKLGGLPLPETLDLTAIDTPEKAALAKAWVDFVDDAARPIKERCMAIAEAHGGQIAIVLPDGTEIAYSRMAKALPRKLGNAVEISEALKDFVMPSQLLGAAELALEKTLELAVPALLEVNPALGTKKAAREAVETTLESMGLLTRGEGQIFFLKRSKKPKK
jgi:hypothetical protein